MPASTGFAACSGCSLCLLGCPVWHQTRDVMLTPQGRAKALQGGAAPEDLADSAAACILCGACEPLCPEGIDVIGMTLEIRSKVRSPKSDVPRRGPDPVPSAVGRPTLDVGPRTSGKTATAPVGARLPTSHRGRKAPPTLLLPGPALAAAPDVLAAVVGRLGGPDRVGIAGDDGRDIVEAIEAGVPVDPERRERFVRGLAGARELVVADGLFHRFLRTWMRRTTLMDLGDLFVRLRERPAIVGLGEALLRVPAVRRAIRPTDLYVIEPRGYHADFQRLVRVYDRLRRETGCETNLDLHRTAVAVGHGNGRGSVGERERESVRRDSPTPPPSHPPTAVDPRVQVRWILEGRKVGRIVIEDLGHQELFRREAGLPVVHVAHVV